MGATVMTPELQTLVEGGGGIGSLVVLALYLRGFLVKLDQRLSRLERIVQKHHGEDDAD